MSEYLQTGQHPDPDSLSAFVEGVLPEHERLQCLAHLAECPSCREVVYFAEEPLAEEPLPAAEKVSFWKRWFRPLPALSFAAAAVTLVLSFWLYRHFRPAPNAPEMVASATHTPEPMAAPMALDQLSPESLSVAKVKPQVRLTAPRGDNRAPGEKKSAIPPPEPDSTATVTGTLAAPVPPLAPSPMAAPAPAAAAPSPLAPARAVPPPAAPQTALVATASADAASAMQSGIAGKITDPAGVAVSGAAVKLRPLTGPASRDLRSDPQGQFDVAGLAPGRYELQVVAPGFKRTTELVDVQPNRIARADSVLQIGSVSESISVTAESAQIQLSSSAKSQAAVQSLPARLSAKTQPAGIVGNLPGATTAVNGKLMLRTDSAGALFLSQNGGKKWKAVKAVWHGTVVSLVALSAAATSSSSSSGPAFQLTTDNGAIWLSRDGSHWYAAPAPK